MRDEPLGAQYAVVENDYEEVVCLYSTALAFIPILLYLALRAVKRLGLWPGPYADQNEAWRDLCH